MKLFRASSWRRFDSRSKRSLVADVRSMTSHIRYPAQVGKEVVGLISAPFEEQRSFGMRRPVGRNGWKLPDGADDTEVCSAPFPSSQMASTVSRKRTFVQLGSSLLQLKIDMGVYVVTTRAFPKRKREREQNWEGRWRSKRFSDISRFSKAQFRFRSMSPELIWSNRLYDPSAYLIPSRIFLAARV
jgi:hypothetical protein